MRPQSGENLADLRRIISRHTDALRHGHIGEKRHHKGDAIDGRRQRLTIIAARGGPHCLALRQKQAAFQNLPVGVVLERKLRLLDCEKGQHRVPFTGRRPAADQFQRPIPVEITDAQSVDIPLRFRPRET